MASWHRLSRAAVVDIARLVTALDPRHVVPIHTRSPLIVCARRAPACWKSVSHMTDGISGRESLRRSGGFHVDIDGRRVYVSIGSSSQTVNVCTPKNLRGEYERRFRLVDLTPLVPDDLSALADLDALYTWLGDIGPAAREVLADSGKADLPPLLHASSGDPWLTETRCIVEDEIDRLVHDFLADPFMHRVEHSVHAEFFTRLKRHPELSGAYLIGATSRRTQLVHKEWPETVADTASGSWRRGSFDLAVLSPNQLETATLDHIRTGRVAAPIVIEFGLNYLFKHLKQDYDKVLASNVEAPYLVHLTRDVRRDAHSEQFILDGDREHRIKIAYAHAGEGGDTAYKLTNDDVIRSSQAPS